MDGSGVGKKNGRNTTRVVKRHQRPRTLAEPERDGVGRAGGEPAPSRRSGRVAGEMIDVVVFEVEPEVAVAAWIGITQRLNDLAGPVAQDFGRFWEWHETGELGFP